MTSNDLHHPQLYGTNATAKDALPKLLSLRKMLGEIPSRILTAHNIPEMIAEEGSVEGDPFYEFLQPNDPNRTEADRRDMYDWAKILKAMLHWEPGQRMKTYQALDNAIFQGF